MKDKYHPGNLTTDRQGLYQDEAPPMSERTVELKQRPILYDAEERPIYRKIGLK